VSVNIAKPPKVYVLSGDDAAAKDTIRMGMVPKPTSLISGKRVF